jgi:hypothetical protein
MVERQDVEWPIVSDVHVNSLLAVSVSRAWREIRGAIRTFCQIPQPFDLWRGEHVFGASPAPVALGPAWHVHPSLGAEVEHILQWSDRERGRRGPRQLHQRRRRIAAPALGSLQVIPKASPLGTRVSSGCRRYRYIPPYWECSCRVGTGYLNDGPWPPDPPDRPTRIRCPVPPRGTLRRKQRSVAVATSCTPA